MEETIGRLDGTGGSDGMEARAERARRSVDALCEAMDRKREALRAMPPEEVKGLDLERLIRELTKAVSTGLEQEGKIDDASRIGGGGGLDLEAARAEIGRRLDLRAGS